jgi:hypothetical protein
LARWLCQIVVRPLVTLGGDVAQADDVRHDSAASGRILAHLDWRLMVSECKT